MEAVGARYEQFSRREARSGRVAIVVDDRHGGAPLSRRSLELLRRTTPRVVRSSDDLVQAPLDHREGFILSLVDGKTSVQVLIDVAAMPEGEVIAALQRLRRLGILTLA